MEEINAMNEKHANSLIKIKLLLREVVDNNFQNDTITIKLLDNKREIAVLSKEVLSLKKKFETEKQKLERKQYESDEHNRLLTDINEEKENLDISLRELEIEHKTMKKAKPSLRDQQLLETGKRKHKLYKEFTCIRWDYSAPESVIEGYITNKKDYLQKISYKSDIDYKTLRDLSWDGVFQSTVDNTRITKDCKENK
ncbi:uncharacterized protein LOC100680539 [Nasonia vitripennis]|uniref:Kinetochore protein Spc24 n=1 Tax=Nasonia vitripennis TaxID=7425 RepID=A0A7M7HAS8_NASVI|nr:uncharacterized protein LOC100680539 [Nasonia vitripennis]